MKTLKDIKKLVKLDDHHNYGDIFTSVKTILLERDELQGTIDGLKHLVELPQSAGLTELFNAVEALELKKSELGDVENLLSNNDLLHDDLLTSLHKLLARPDTTQPQLNEIRYVLHGDIQPCTVLYSDDTTTLLRLDEGDIMCETDTIEWSDSVTYRCQELGRSAGMAANALGGMARAMAQLVRDERILLNDDTLETGGVEVQCCSQCGHEFDETLTICPQCHYEWTSNNSPTPLR